MSFSPWPRTSSPEAGKTCSEGRESVSGGWHPSCARWAWETGGQEKRMATRCSWEGDGRRWWCSVQLRWARPGAVQWDPPLVAATLHSKLLHFSRFTIFSGRGGTLKGMGGCTGWNWYLFVFPSHCVCFLSRYRIRRGFISIWFRKNLGVADKTGDELKYYL